MTVLYKSDYSIPYPFHCWKYSEILHKFINFLPSVHIWHPFRGQKSPRSTVRPQNAPSVWTGGGNSPSASTKYLSPVDKSLPAAPSVHKTHPLCGQAEAILPPRPQNTSRLWTKAPLRHQTSTKCTLCVDRRKQFSLRVHKIPLACGQKPLRGTVRPQTAPQTPRKPLFFFF